MSASPDPRLRISLGGIDLENPVMVASGTFGAGREADRFIDLARIGGIIVKSMTLAPWRGKPTPRMCETPSGMLNAIGIQNKGVDHFVEHDLPWLKRRGAAVIASIAGNTVEEFAGVGARLAQAQDDITAVEVNISCPNLEDRNNMFAHSPRAAAAVVRAVKAEVGELPVFPKLSPNVTSLSEIAAAALEGGADGLSLINTVMGMAIDVESRRPRLGGTTGGLSGPAIRPIAVRAVHEVHRAFPHVPLIGQGGVGSAADAVEMMLAGATAVAVGTMNFVHPDSSLEVTRGLSEYLERHEIDSVRDLVGSVKIEE